MTKKTYILFLFISVLLILTFIGNTDVKADSIEISGFIQEFDEDYDYKVGKGKFSYTDGNNTWGILKIDGNLEKISDKSYNVTDGVFTLSYDVNFHKYNLSEGAWHIEEDSDDDVDDMELDDDVERGAIIIRTSFDGSKWTLDKALTDVFYSGSASGINFYSGKMIQLINGCHYQITVVYRQKRRIDDSWKPWVSNWENRWILERYEFYVENTEEKNKSLDPYDKPRNELGQVVKTSKNNGYSGIEPLDKDDPHYGWDLGTFVINGYTQTGKDNNGNDVYIKKPGDKVTLWFCLNQNINRLRNNENLSIVEDKEGSDQYFQTSTMNFKRGALIIRHIDYEGTRQTPIIYTNYLEANTKTGAYTKVELFEEGDYEVALDYKILNTKGIDSTTDYRIFFKFSLRNGSCTVFPRDVETRGELSDKSITQNGFDLDLAKSRYLNINVEQKVIKKNADGYYEATIRSMPAKDGDTYTDEGIYTITVNNQYTGASLEKTIYVGEHPLYKTLIKYNMSLSDINSKIHEGCDIGPDGEIITPIPTATETPPPNEPSSIEISNNDKVESNDEVNTVESGSKTWIFFLIVGIVFIGVSGTCLYKFVLKNNKGSNTYNTDSSTFTKVDSDSNEGKEAKITDNTTKED